MIAAVIAYPIAWSELGDDPNGQSLFEYWAEDATAWCERTWGNRLHSVVEHLDEDYPHLHAFIVPEMRADGTLAIEDVHPGIKARKKAYYEDRGTIKQSQAYSEAMEKLLDDFYEVVSRKYGHARKGDEGRRRVGRKYALAVKRQRAEELRANVEEALAIREAHALKATERAEFAAIVDHLIETVWPAAASTTSSRTRRPDRRSNTARSKRPCRPLRSI